MTQQHNGTTAAIAEGRTSLGVELGSTNIKACLIGPDHQVLATGSHGWENQFVDRLWTYSENAIWTGLQAAVASVRTLSINVLFFMILFGWSLVFTIMIA